MIQNNQLQLRLLLMTCFLHIRENFLPSCQQPEQHSLDRRQESWRQASPRWAWEVCAACDGLGWRVFGVKGRLHFVDESAKVDSAYVGRVLPSLVDDCTRMLPSGYIFQQNGEPAHTARTTQNWLQTNCPDFIAKDQWPPNSPDLNALDYRVWGNVGGLSQAPSETENDRRTEGSHAGDLGQPTSVTNYTKLSKSSQSD